MFIRYFCIVLTSCIVWESSLYAETKVQNTQSVKALVAQVKAAPSSKRRVLMNKLKLKLRSMHKEIRKQIMLDLRDTFSQKHTPMTSSMMQSCTTSQNTMMMNQSRNMQEYMNRDAMSNVQMQGMTNPMQPSIHRLPKR